MVANSDTHRRKVGQLRDRVALLERRIGAASRVSDSQTPGGLSGYDSAILSGIRRKPNHKADSRRFAAYDREASLVLELQRAQADLAASERALANAEAMERSQAEVTPDAIKSAKYVCDAQGWHEVVRVSAKSVTVKTPWSWTERIPLDRIIDTRSAGDS